jgi:hypothetical protein
MSPTRQDKTLTQLSILYGYIEPCLWFNQMKSVMLLMKKT